MEVREEVLEFAEEMEKVLLENDWKGGWAKDNVSFLFCKLVEEIGEVGNLFARLEGLCDEDETVSAIEVHKECVDVANIAMMLASKFKTRD